MELDVGIEVEGRVDVCRVEDLVGMVPEPPNVSVGGSGGGTKVGAHWAVGPSYICNSGVTGAVVP